ncbi:MAG: hypothetical protein ACOX1Q_06120 [Eubacteriales bacterium]|jgi:hypothetical protein
MPDSDYYLSRRRSLFPLILTILIIHIVFAFTTFFLMYFMAMFLSESAAQTVGSILSILLFFAMMYTEMWRSGQQDRNLMNFGHLADDRFRGLKASLLSQIPGFLLSVLALISRLTDSLSTFFVSAYKLFYAPFVDLIWFAEQATPLLFPLFTLITPVVVHIGYLLGYKGYAVSDKFYKKNTNNDIREKKFK